MMFTLLFRLTRLILIAGIISFVSLSCAKEVVVPEGHVALSLLDSVNRLRLKGCKCGNDTMPPVKSLIWNTPLAIAAGKHAADMYHRNYFEHISPDGSSPVQRALAAGYAGNTVLENIAKGFSTESAVMAAWKASEGHCRAMMDSGSVEMGAYSYETFWVQEFGR